MALSAAVVREHADALNINFTAAQAALILALVNAASDAAAADVAALGLPAAAPSGDGDYNLTITSGVATWTAEGA